MLYEVWQACGEADGSGYWGIWNPITKTKPLKDAKVIAKYLAGRDGYPTEVRKGFKILRYYDSNGKRADRIFSSYEEKMMCS